VGVGLDRERGLRKGHLEPVARRLDERGGALDHSLEDLLDGHHLAAQLNLAAVDAGDVEQVVHEPPEVAQLPPDHRQRMCGLRVVRVALDDGKRVDDRRQRVAQFVAQDRDELRLAAVALAQRLFGGTALGHVHEKPDDPVAPGVVLREGGDGALAASRQPHLEVHRDDGVGGCSLEDYALDSHLVCRVHPGESIRLRKRGRAFRQTEQGGGLRRQFHRLGVSVVDEDTAPRCEHREPQELFLFAECPQAAFALDEGAALGLGSGPRLGDVGQDPDEPGGAGQEPAAGRDPAHAPVGRAADPELRVVVGSRARVVDGAHDRRPVVGEDELPPLGPPALRRVLRNAEQLASLVGQCHHRRREVDLPEPLSGGAVGEGQAALGLFERKRRAALPDREHHQAGDGGHHPQFLVVQRAARAAAEQQRADDPFRADQRMAGDDREPQRREQAIVRIGAGMGRIDDGGRAAGCNQPAQPAARVEALDAGSGLGAETRVRAKGQRLPAGAVLERVVEDGVETEVGVNAGAQVARHLVGPLGGEQVRGNAGQQTQTLGRRLAAHGRLKQALTCIGREGGPSRPRRRWARLLRDPGSEHPSADGVARRAPADQVAVDLGARSRRGRRGRLLGHLVGARLRVEGLLRQLRVHRERIGLERRGLQCFSALLPHLVGRDDQPLVEHVHRVLVLEHLRHNRAGRLFLRGGRRRDARLGGHRAVARAALRDHAGRGIACGLERRRRADLLRRLAHVLDGAVHVFGKPGQFLVAREGAGGGGCAVEIATNESVLDLLNLREVVVHVLDDLRGRESLARSRLPARLLGSAAAGGNEDEDTEDDRRLHEPFHAHTCTSGDGESGPMPGTTWYCPEAVWIVRALRSSLKIDGGEAAPSGDPAGSVLRPSVP